MTLLLQFPKFPKTIFYKKIIIQRLSVNTVVNSLEKVEINNFPTIKVKKKKIYTPNINIKSKVNFKKIILKDKFISKQHQLEKTIRNLVEFLRKRIKLE